MLKGQDTKPRLSRHNVLTNAFRLFFKVAGNFISFSAKYTFYYKNLGFYGSTK